MVIVLVVVVVAWWGAESFLACVLGDGSGGDCMYFWGSSFLSFYLYFCVWVVEWMEGGWYHFARKAAVNWRLEKSGQGAKVGDVSKRCIRMLWVFTSGCLWLFVCVGGKQCFVILAGRLSQYSFVASTVTGLKPVYS
jgi:hypothetical protein